MSKSLRPSDIDRLEPYEKWFAWHPVRTWEGKWVWMRVVWRAICDWKDFDKAFDRECFFIYTDRPADAP